MLGVNKVSHLSKFPPTILNVNSIFSTIQGEGPFAGTPAIFIRLADCNLRCFWCDTNFKQTGTMGVESIVNTVTMLRSPSGYLPNLVVITGGEPLLQQLFVLVEELNKRGFLVQVETAGTPTPLDFDMLKLQFIRPKFKPGNSIVCSPKTRKIADWIIPYVSAWKYIITDKPVDVLDGLPIHSTQMINKEDKLFRPPPDHIAPIFVQPCDFGKHDLRSKLALDQTIMVAKNFGYRLSLQIHKIIGEE